jgi:hypothetical protein
MKDEMYFSSFRWRGGEDSLSFFFWKEEEEELELLVGSCSRS